MKTLLCTIAYIFFTASIGAQTWTSLNSPTGFKNVKDIAVTYRSGNSDTMYAADEVKVLKSVDAGQAWSATSSMLAGATSVTCKYDNHWTVLAAGTSVFSRSTDGGSSWTSVSGFVNKPIALVNFPANTSVMLAGKKYYSTNERSIARSTDAGATWIHNDLSTSYKTQMFDIAINVSGAYPSMVVAAGCAIDATVNDKGLYYSEDYGDTWVARMASTGTGWSAVAFRYHSATENQDTVYAGTAGGEFYRSTWKASSMSLLYTFPDTIRSITIHPDSTWILYVTTDRSVYKSTNKGSTWNNYITGMLDTRSFALKFKPGTASNMVVGSRGYLYRTTNYGTNWSQISSTTTRTLPTASVTTGGSKAFAGSGELTVGLNFNGASWSSVRVGHKDSLFYTNHSSNLYNGSNRVIYHAGIGDNTSNVYRSLDTGATFTAVPEFSTLTLNTFVSGIAQDPSYPQVLFAYGFMRDGVNARDFFKSNDYGTSWTKSTNTPTTIDGWLSFQILGDGSGSASQYMYSGVEGGNGNGGIWRSTNGGSSWERVDADIGDVDITTITNHPNNVGYVYAGGDGGLWFSSNATHADKNLVDFTNKWSTADVKKVVIDPRFRNGTYSSAYIFFVGDNTIYRSENNGTTSASVLGDLPGGTVINDFRTDPNDTTLLYVATDRGIFKAQLPTRPHPLLSPADGVDSVLCCASQAPLVFSWTSAAGATSYDIQIDDDSNFAIPEENHVGVGNPFSFTNNLDNCNTWYYWRVRSNATGFGPSPWSARFSFKSHPCAAQQIGPPTNPSPASGATGVALNPWLRWSPVVGALKYKVVVDGLTTVFTTDTSTQLAGLAENTWYTWHVTALNCAANPASTWSFRTCTNCPTGPQGPETVHDAVDEENAVTEYALLQNYPNPFNPITRFDYALLEDAHVQLRIYNSLGQEIATLVDEAQSRGWKTVEYDASHLPSGVYFYRINAGPFVSIKKMLFLK